MSDTSALDLEETIAFYTTIIPLRINSTSFPYPVDHEGNICLSPRELGGLFALFPLAAQQRSILRRVTGQQRQWFHKDSTPQNPIPTRKVKDALSPTACIPSYIDYSLWQQTGIPSADIHLYDLPSALPLSVRRLIIMQGFVHEIGHSIVQPALYVPNYNLQFEDGSQKPGLEFLIEYAQAAERFSPISVYSSFYRTPQNTFPEDAKTPISEELCESIAAYLLGFTFSKEEDRRRDPFNGREELKVYVQKFLNAQRIQI